MQIIKNFFKLESTAGILLFLAAIAAIIIVNSPGGHFYNAFLSMPFSLQAGTFILKKPAYLWINDGLMAVYFLLIGLEIKREMLFGELKKKSQAVLPAVCAVGGLLMPALLYALFNGNNSLTAQGWAIPAATDIAFSLGVLSLLTSRVPLSLKIFLTAVAIFDDMGAIIIIAVFYTSDLSIFSLLMAAAIIIGLFIMNRVLKVRHMGIYLLLGALLWICILKSGVHATLAGITLALFIPMEKDPKLSPGHRLEHNLHSWTTYFILPIFAFANAGVSLDGLSWNLFNNTITLGILTGLFIGKQLGIFSACWLMIKLNWASMPSRATWGSLYGISLLCGIGFTMSLFIGSLAFPSEYGAEYTQQVRFGVLSGSLISGLMGYLILRFTTKPSPLSHQK